MNPIAVMLKQCSKPSGQLTRVEEPVLKLGHGWTVTAYRDEHGLYYEQCVRDGIEKWFTMD
jgi:hypothetical protein